VIAKERQIFGTNNRCESCQSVHDLPLRPARLQGAANQNHTTRYGALRRSVGQHRPKMRFGRLWNDKPADLRTETVRKKFASYFANEPATDNPSYHQRSRSDTQN
jgi:hypothetical protein